MRTPGMTPEDNVAARRDVPKPLTDAEAKAELQMWQDFANSGGAEKLATMFKQEYALAQDVKSAAKDEWTYLRGSVTCDTIASCATIIDRRVRALRLLLDSAPAQYVGQ